MGLLQYLTPILQFLIGVFVVHEAMPPARWVGLQPGVGGARAVLGRLAARRPLRRLGPADATTGHGGRGGDDDGGH